MRTARGSSCPWGGGLPQCMLGYTTPPGVGLETPPGVGLETPPWPNPSTSNLGVGLETPQETCCKGCWDTTLPGDLLQGMLGYHLQGMLGYHPSPPPPRPSARHAWIPPTMHAGISPPPPVNRITDTCKNITLPQLRCGR